MSCNFREIDLPVSRTGSSEMEEILSSLLAAGGVAILSFIWFIIMRKRESLFYMPRVIKQHSITTNYDDSWLKNLIRYNEDELMKEKGGIDGALYLKFLKYSTLLFLALTIFGVTVLLPVYSLGKATDDGEPITGLDRYSLANLEEGSFLYWFALASIVLFTLFSWVFTYKLYNQYVTKVNYRQYESTPVSRTIMVENVPKSITTDQEFKDFWRNLYGHRVKDAFLVPKLKSLSRFVKKRDKLRVKLLRATEREEKAGKSLFHYEYYGFWKFIPFSSRLFGAKIESVTTYRRRLAAIDSLIAESREKQHKRTHVGFVIFDSVAACMQAAQTLHKTKPTSMLVEPATDPSGVRWDSLHLNRNNILRKGISYLSLLALFLFWSIPITIISALSNLENLAKVPGLNFLVDVVSLSPVVRGFVDGFLPSLALLLFLAFAPDIIYAILSVRGWYLQRNLDRRVFQNYWLFILINVFLIITVVGSIFGALYNILERPATLVESLAESVPQQALFFTNYIILQGLFSIPLFHVARITDYIVWKIQSFRKSPREKREIPAKDMYIYFAENYGKNLLIFTIGLVYSSIAPIVLPFTFLYFLLNYFSARYNWMYVIQPKYEGVRMTRLVIDRIFVGILLYQITMLGIFGLGKFYFGAFTTAIIVATLTYRYHLHRRFKMPSRYLALEKCPGPDKARGDASKLFLHPSLKDTTNEDEEIVEGEKEEHNDFV